MRALKNYQHICKIKITNYYEDITHRTFRYRRSEH